MSNRLAAVAFLDGQRPAGPVHRSIMAVDLEGSTMRTNIVKGELRRVIYDLLGHSLEAAAITGNRLEPLIDRGDGVLVLIRPHDDVPKTVLLDRLIPLLTTLLTEYNAQVPQPTLQIRLRVVVHAGEVHLDRRGFYGEAIDIAIRLLDSPQVKRALKQATAPLVLVVSDEIYSGIVCHGYVAADTYSPLVRVRVANRRHLGWVHIPAPAASPVVAGPAAGGRSPGASRSSVLDAPPVIRMRCTAPLGGPQPQSSWGNGTPPRNGTYYRTRRLRVRSFIRGYRATTCDSMTLPAEICPCHGRKIPDRDGWCRGVPGHPSEHGANADPDRSRPICRVPVRG